MFNFQKSNIRFYITGALSDIPLCRIAYKRVRVSIAINTLQHTGVCNKNVLQFVVADM